MGPKINKDVTLLAMESLKGGIVLEEASQLQRNALQYVGMGLGLGLKTAMMETKMM